MKLRMIHPLAAVGLAASIAVSGCSGSSSAAGSSESADGEAVEMEAPEGPHGGILLEDGNFALEMTIFESGVPPEYRIYPFYDGEPISPSQVDLSVRLGRLGGNDDVFGFAPVQDYLRGDGVVTEPHSFEVFVDFDMNTLGVL